MRLASAVPAVLVVAMAQVAAAAELLAIRSLGDATVYIYPATVERSAGSSKVWSLWNHTSDQLNVYEEHYRSARILSEYDCRNWTVRLIEIHEHQLPLGQGRPLRTYGGEGVNERGVPRGSVGDKIRELVCSPSPLGEAKEF